MHKNGMRRASLYWCDMSRVRLHRMAYIAVHANGYMYLYLLWLAMCVCVTMGCMWTRVSFHTLGCQATELIHHFFPFVHCVSTERTNEQTVRATVVKHTSRLASERTPIQRRINTKRNNVTTKLRSTFYFLIHNTLTLRILVGGALRLNIACTRHGYYVRCSMFILSIYHPMAKWNLFARSSAEKAHDDDDDGDSMLHGRISSHAFAIRMYVLNVILHTLRILSELNFVEAEKNA